MILIYTDGSCLSNPGPGGWAAIILNDISKKILKGGENNTTNNRMEMMAVISGLESVSNDGDVTIYSDSKYVINSITLGWKRKANLDLWELLDQQLIGKNVVNMDLQKVLMDQKDILNLILCQNQKNKNILYIYIYR